MQEKPFLVTYEDETTPMRIARQGSKGYLTVKKLMDPEDTGSVSGIVLVAEALPHQQPITPHGHGDYEESMYVLTGHGKMIIGPTADDMKTFTLRPGACAYVPADYYHIVEVDGEQPMKLIISYFSTEKKGKSHREIATELTNVPLQGEYGK
jgi:mannose-6-phosphate isomerase-like protein (cupin superfamily)